MSEPVEHSLPSEQVTAVAEVEHAVDSAQLLRIFEAALLTTQEPLSIGELKRLSEIPVETRFVEELLQKLADKYADSGIVDLRFAHRDAEIFAEYLHSAAGAGLPSENIRLLTNAQATLAAIDDGLNWLLTTSKKGDRVIVYFSGHGDVEKQTLWQRGYLLAHDTPYPNLRNNAVRVEELLSLIHI